MNEKEIQDLRDVIEAKVKDIAEGSSYGVFKGYHIYELTYINTGEVRGLLVEIYVSRKLHYYDFLLKNWKNRLTAVEYYITCKKNNIAICFKIRGLKSKCKKCKT